MIKKKCVNRDFSMELVNGELTKEVEAHAEEAFAKLREANETKEKHQMTGGSMMERMMAIFMSEETN